MVDPFSGRIEDVPNDGKTVKERTINLTIRVNIVSIREDGAINCVEEAPEKIRTVEDGSPDSEKNPS